MNPLHTARAAARRLGAALDRTLERRPKLTAALARYGMLAFVVLGAVFIAAGAATPEGRGQQIVYAGQDGGIYSVAPEGGERLTIHAPNDDSFATAPLLNGGSRSLSFTVFHEGDGGLRGDLYGADLVRATEALIQTANPGEAFVYGGYSSDREWLMAERFSVESPPNVAVFTASGASRRYVEPEDEADAATVNGASWTARNSLYAWLSGGSRMNFSLTAYDFFERRQAVVYRTENRVGRASYNFGSNTAVFDERPLGGDLEASRLTALAGTAEMPVSGVDGIGVYDPSLPIPELDDGMAALWTDGQTTGLGIFDPARWSFERTNIEVEPGSRYPQVSYDGSYLTTLDDSGTTLTVRRMDDGEIVGRIEDIQPPDEAVRMMREAGMNVPDSAEWTAPAPYTWRSFAAS